MEPMNDYERQREERIQRNNAILEQLGVHTAAQALTAGRGRRPPQRLKRKAPVKAAVRKCARLSREDQEGPKKENLKALNTEHDELMTLRDYFKWKGQDVNGIIVDGQYRGWVCPAICKKYGIPDSEEEAFALGGSGRGGSKGGKTGKMHGWSNARAFSATQLRTNPNAYFYRHVAPDEEQAQGDWTEEEHELFLETAKANGVGDKWGLFASHIPARVGYQCSAYYRETIIPRGLILDPRFRMSRAGKAIFVG
ncbi:g8298 [Coccomyxa elongata]